MIGGLELPMGVVEALFLLGVVLVEAVLLYIGYGYVEDIVAPSVLEKIENI